MDGRQGGGRRCSDARRSRQWVKLDRWREAERLSDGRAWQREMEMAGQTGSKPRGPVGTGPNDYTRNMAGG